MKTTILTIAMGLATMSMTFAQVPTPAPTGAAQPAVTAPAKTSAAKTTKKHHKRAVKKAAKTPAASAVVAK